MNHPTLARFAVLLALAVSGVWGQPPMQQNDPIKYELVTGAATPADDPWKPNNRYRAAEARVENGSYDPAADALLQGAEKFTKVLFNVPSLKFQKAATERVASGSERGDVLSAKWNFQEPFGNGSIILLDTPYYSTFAVRLGDCPIRSQAELTAALKALLNNNGPGRLPVAPAPGSPPGNLKAPPTFIRFNAPALTFFDVSPPPRSPFMIVADFKFFGALEGKDWYLDFRVGKSLVNHYYPVPGWVPERFPPLRELVKSWSSDRIHNELGSPVKPFEGAPDFTADRDRILMGELASRGIAPAQVTEFLTNGPATADGYSQRLSLLIAGFAVAGMSFEKQYFASTLATYDHIGPVADGAVTVLFRAASAAGHGCSAEFENQALAEIKKGIFLQGPINYSAVCSSSPETLAALEAANMPGGDLERSKVFAARQIRNRIDRTRKRIPQKKSAQIQ